ncbi:hypothetical protein C0J52_21724 [Blattella germanica]|nr:hypothetical protein C0J52_21724 [Blattella germanica]
MAGTKRAWLICFLVFAVNIFIVNCASHFFEPSPYEYGIVQQAERRNNTHNLILGWRQYGDKILYRGLIKQSYKFLGTTNATFRYPTWGNSKENITNIVALDQYGSTGGYVNVTGGGVGLGWVTLSFKSQFNRGLKYLVEIYGK